MPITPLVPGSTFPEITVPQLGGGEMTLGSAGGDHDWQLVIVYRGKHCPVCTGYLQQFEKRRAEFDELGIELVAVSSDSEDRASDQIVQVKSTYRVGYGLSVDQMKQMGLMISGPHNGKDVAGPFAEPGLFVVDQDRNLRVMDISNVPFARPDINTLLLGLNFVRKKMNDGYAVSGNHM
ncbi:MAG: redoxin domain-containing protein [Erythrobacter sp.]|uniref:redoxin domain-containing protein n=1 Tax=Erythrobacter sp. TaxID=1042 RepID=UPI003298242E